MNSVHFYVLLLCLVDKSCLIFCGPMDYSPPDSSALGILQQENTGVGCHFLFQGIFPTQESKLHLLHWQADSLLLSHQWGYKSLDSLWPFLWYAPLLSRANILCFLILSLLRVRLLGGRWLQWLMAWSGSYFHLELPWGSPWRGELQCDDLMGASSFVYWYERWHFFHWH